MTARADAPDTEWLTLRLGAMREALKALEVWIGAVPHGDNCFVCNHYDGDPGNQCNCGRDSALAMIDTALSAPAPPPEPAPAAPSQDARLVERLRRPRGVGRDAENPRCLILYFDEVPTDDDLRGWHEAASALAARDAEVERLRGDSRLLKALHRHEVDRAEAAEAEVARLTQLCNDSLMVQGAARDAAHAQWERAERAEAALAAALEAAK